MFGSMKPPYAVVCPRCGAPMHAKVLTPEGEATLSINPRIIKYWVLQGKVKKAKLTCWACAFKEA